MNTKILNKYISGEEIIKAYLGAEGSLDPCIENVNPASQKDEVL